MKKMTMKEVKRVFKNVLSIGYCDAWHLLKHIDRVGYNSGVYGWNADIYVINYNTAIITGYRPTGNVHPDHEVLRKYNELAKKIEYTTYEEYFTRHDKLLTRFTREVLGGANND